MAPRITHGSWNWNFTARLVAIALVGLLAAGGLAANEPEDTRRAAVRSSIRQGPSFEGKQPAYLMTRRLHDGYASALSKIHRIRSCQDLFARLETHGLEVLSRTTNTFAQSEWAAEICADANAFMTVGGSTVWICGGFECLSEQDAAKVLIHEALHNAGLAIGPRISRGRRPRGLRRWSRRNAVSRSDPRGPNSKSRETLAQRVSACETNNGTNEGRM